MITRIEITNLMSHRQSVIEPAEGLTVICGPNNIGKSSVVAALQVLCYNDNSTYVMRHGAKECHVVVETDDGHRIEWARKGSPAYYIDGERFDRLKGGVPEELHEILRMPRIASKSGNREFDLHFGEQKSPVFLLNESHGVIAQFFAASSDAGHLIAMQNRHKENIKASKRDKERLTAEKSRLASRLDMLKPVDEIKRKAVACAEQFDAITVLDEESRMLDDRISAIERAEIDAVLLGSRSAVLEGLEPLPDFHDTAVLEKTTGELEFSTRQIAAASAELECLQALEAPPQIYETARLEELCREMENLETRVQSSTERLLVLDGLSPPPEIADIESLKDSIAELEDALASSDRLNRAAAVLKKLESPPDRLPLEQLAAMIESLECQNATITALEKQRSRLETRVRSARADIESWAAQNPTCPTCGGEIHPDNLLCNLNTDKGADE